MRRDFSLKNNLLLTQLCFNHGCFICISWWYSFLSVRLCTTNFFVYPNPSERHFLVVQPIIYVVGSLVRLTSVASDLQSTHIDLYLATSSSAPSDSSPIGFILKKKHFIKSMSPLEKLPLLFYRPLAHQARQPKHRALITRCYSTGINIPVCVLTPLWGFLKWTHQYYYVYLQSHNKGT